VEREAIESALAVLAERRAGSDHRAIVAATDAVNRSTAEFAARRMDRGVARALAGKRVDALNP